MILDIGSKVRLCVSNDKPQIGFITHIKEDKKFKVYYGHLIGKNKNGSFEIVERDDAIGGTIYWPPEFKRPYNASFIEDFEVLTE